MDFLVDCSNLKKSYGRRPVLHDFSLQLERGRIIGLLGPNGSGKTTFIKILAGILSKNSGEIKISGRQIGIESKKIVSYLPERTYFSPSMKVKDTIKFFEDFYKDFKRERAEQMLSGLDISLNSKIKELSKGTREKVQLVLVMSREAELYLLDEPMGGVDPAARDYILKTILTNYNENASVIISTHLISDVEKVLDDVVFIKEGNVVLHQSVDEIRRENGMSVDALFREVFAC
jgi:ABC-2 type transport system ATP-binding protein